jgi:hypothetical protein
LSSDESAALPQELTVPETYFFRNSDQFRAFTDVARPDRLREQAGTGACASSWPRLSAGLAIVKRLAELRGDTALKFLQPLAS